MGDQVSLHLVTLYYIKVTQQYGLYCKLQRLRASVDSAQMDRLFKYVTDYRFYITIL